MTDNLSSVRVARTPAGVSLCLLADVSVGTARGFVLQMKAGRFHGFVVRRESHLRGYADICPHAGLPLAERLDDYLTPDGAYIKCSWHGALFSILDGTCLGGPCAGQALSPWPVAVEAGWIVTR